MADPVTDPSPSPSPAPVATPAPAPVAQAVASQPIVTSPATQTPTTPPVPAQTPAQASAPAKPVYVPEAFWDATAGKVKEAEFADHFNQMQTRIAADDVKALSRPQSPADYKIELPADFKAPVGAPEFKFNEADPLLSQAKDWAHKRGLDQDTFKEALALYAGSQIVSAQQVTAAREAEIAKLGTTGPARVDAVTNFLKGMVGEQVGRQLASRMFTASDVQAMEALVTRMASQGSAAFTARGREPPPQAGKLSDADYKKLSPGEKLDYAKQFDQSKFNTGRAA